MKVQSKRFKTMCLLTVSGVAIFTANGALATSDPFAPAKSATVVTTEGGAPVEFTLGVSAGYLTGEATELVYWPDVNNHKASELTWNIDSLYMLGIDAELEFFERLTVNLEAWFKVTDGEGTMDDYDWQIVGGDWTDWSHHEDTDVTDAYMFDLSVGGAFYKTEKALFRAIVGYKADNFGWEARGGDYVYSVSGFRDAKGSFPDGELGISYEQTYSAFYLGLGTEVKVSNFKAEAKIIYAPYVYAEATDNHHMRNLVVYDTVDEFGEGNMIAIDVSGSYYFTDKLSLGLGITYQSYNTMTGDSEWHFRDDGTVYLSEDGAGMDLSFTMITTTLKYNF